MNKELAEAVKLFVSQPLNFPLSRGQIMEVARIALPILEQQERGEGEWIEWGGDIDDLPPVGGRVFVEVRWSDESVDSGEARQWRWSHESDEEGIVPNIIAYRIIATNQNGEQ